MRILCFLGVTITFSFIFRVVFYLYLRSFYHQQSLLFSQTSCTIMCVAAFLIWIIELYFCGISVEWQTKRRSCFATSTLLSQLIFSLAGILMQRGLSCNACAWQSFLRLRPDVAWLMHSTLVKWNLVTFQWQLFSLCSSVTTHMRMRTDTHTQEEICQQICICQEVIVSM